MEWVGGTGCRNELVFRLPVVNHDRSVERQRTRHGRGGRVAGAKEARDERRAPAQFRRGACLSRPGHEARTTRLFAPATRGAYTWSRRFTSPFLHPVVPAGGS